MACLRSVFSKNDPRYAERIPLVAEKISGYLRRSNHPSETVYTPSESLERGEEEEYSSYTPSQSPEREDVPLASSSSNWDDGTPTRLENFRASRMYKTLLEKVDIISQDHSLHDHPSNAEGILRHGFVRFVEGYPPLTTLSWSWVHMQKAVLETLQDDHPRRENLALLRKVSARPNGRCGHSWKGDERVYPKGNRQLLADDVKGLITLYKNEYRAVGATSRGLHLRDLHTHCVGVRWRSLTSQEWKKLQKTANFVFNHVVKFKLNHCSSFLAIAD